MTRPTCEMIAEKDCGAKIQTLFAALVLGYGEKESKNAYAWGKYHCGEMRKSSNHRAFSEKTAEPDANEMRTS